MEMLNLHYLAITQVRVLSRSTTGFRRTMRRRSMCGSFPGDTVRPTILYCRLKTLFRHFIWKQMRQPRQPVRSNSLRSVIKGASPNGEALLFFVGYMFQEDSFGQLLQANKAYRTLCRLDTNASFWLNAAVSSKLDLNHKEPGASFPRN